MTKQIWSGTLGEAIKLGKMTQKEADEMLRDYSDEEQDAYDEGILAERKRIFEGTKENIRELMKFCRHNREAKDRLNWIKAQIEEDSKR